MDIRSHNDIQPIKMGLVLIHLPLGKTVSLAPFCMTAKSLLLRSPEMHFSGAILYIKSGMGFLVKKRDMGVTATYCEKHWYYYKKGIYTKGSTCAVRNRVLLI